MKKEIKTTRQITTKIDTNIEISSQEVIRILKEQLGLLGKDCIKIIIPWEYGEMIDLSYLDSIIISYEEINVKNE